MHLGKQGLGPLQRVEIELVVKRMILQLRLKLLQRLLLLFDKAEMAAKSLCSRI